MFRLNAFLPIYQMSVLTSNRLFTVLDFKNLARGCCRIKYYHVKLAHRKLKHKYLFFRICHFRLEQNDIFQHSPFDLIQNPLLDSHSLWQG